MKYWYTLIVVLALSLCSTQAQVAIIANKSVNVSAIDKGTLLSIYLLESKTLGDVKLNVFDLKEETTTKMKVYGVLGFLPSAMRKEWLRAKLTGAGDPPTAVATEEDMLAKVASTPGGIGYVSFDKVTSAVKVLMRIN